MLKLLLQFGVNPEDYDALAEQILEGVATSRKRMRRAGHSGRKSSGYTASSSRNSIIVPRQGLLYRWTEHSTDLFFLNFNWGRKKDTPNYTLFWTMISYNNSHQDLSNEGPNFILS